MSMAITLGGVASVLVGFNTGEGDASTSQIISKRTIDIITIIYTPVSLFIMIYALFTYEWRRRFMHKKQVSVQICLILVVFSTISNLQTMNRLVPVLFGYAETTFSALCDPWCKHA